MTDAVVLRRGARASLRSGRAAAREQALVASGQILSGLGNLLYAGVMARVLAPGAFAELAAFLALYLLIAVPSLSLAASGTIDPSRARRRRGRVLAGSVPFSLGIGALAVVLAPALGLSLVTALALATTPTLVALIELDRGRLYGERAYRWVTGSLVAEPLLRLAVGTVLATSFGVGGAAAGVVVGGLGGLLVARAGRGRGAGGRAAERGPPRDARRPATRAALLTFLFLALVQCQDVVFANATLGGVEAARFAAISTLGGVAVFATATIPFVLMPRAKEGEPGALGAALAAAGLLGGGAVLVTLVASELLLSLAYGGGEYLDVSALLPPYMLAMGLLGVARVLAANSVARGGRRVPWFVAAAAALQLGLLLLLGGSAGGIALATLLASAALTAALTLDHAVAERRRRAPRPEPINGTEALPEPPALAPSRWRRTALILLGLLAGAIALRLLAGRSLWLDEATSWYETQLPFHRMLEVLRTTDVHPPGYFAVLWATVRGFGDSELALRLPSLLEAAALVPMLFVAGRAMYDRETGLVAAAFGAIAPIVVWYSQEARMYAQLMLLAVVAVWALHQALETRGFRYWFVYALAGAAMAWTHYFALLPLLVFEGAIALSAWQEARAGASVRRLVLGGALATILLLVLAAPLVPFAHDQFAANQAAGKGFNQPTQAGGAVDNQISLYAALTNGIWGVFGYHSNATMANLTALWPLLLLLALMVLGRGRSRATLLLIAAVLLPTAMLTGLALGQPFLFELRYNITAVPLMLLLGARAATAWPHGALGRRIVVAAAIAALGAGLADQELNGTNPRSYDFEGALQKVDERSGPDDVLMYRPNDLNNLIAYYPPGLRTRRLGERMPAASVPRVFVLESFFEDPSNGEAVRKALAKLRGERRLVGRFHFSQVEVWEFR